MTDAIRTLTQLQSDFADNTTRAIDEQDDRNAIYSMLGVVPYVAKSTDYTATENDEFIAVATSSADITITLPAAASTRVGKRYTVKKTDANVHDVIIDPNSSEAVDGSLTSITISTQYEAWTLVSAGAAWLVESHYTP